MNKEIKGLPPKAFSNLVFERNRKLGSDACEILACAIQAVDPYKCVSEFIQLDRRFLNIGDQSISIKQINQLVLIGFGKAAVPMAKGVIDKLGNKLHSANVIVKDTKFLDDNGYKNKLSVYSGGHPVPTDDSLIATQTLLKNIPQLTDDDLVLVVISGGGSALFTEPVHGVTFEDLRNLTHLLLKCGADINEINTLRKHLDQVKGGRLAMNLQPAYVCSLILSDVIGDRLDMIASGPTIADPTTFEEALNILERYGLIQVAPEAIVTYLRKGRDGIIPETLKPGQLPKDKVTHHLVGTNFIAAEAARRHAETLGYNTAIISTALTGCTDHIAKFLDGILQTEIMYERPVEKPACLIFGGEPTVNVLGDGLGGRNMDLALRMVDSMQDKPKTLFVSFATDGDDGPTDAAGAAVDAHVYHIGQEYYGLSTETFINNSDSYHYFDKVGGLIKSGSTGTNVNDLVLLMVDMD